MTNIEVPPVSGSGKVESKVKAATRVTFVVSLVGTVLLEWTSSDLIPALPGNLNWLSPILLSAVATAAAFVGGYVTKTKPESLSQSTVDAIREWMRKRLQHRGGNV